MTRWQTVLLTLRTLMEAGIVVALAYWGYHEGNALATKVAIMIAAPLAGFGFWGAVDFRQFGKISEALRLAQELAISGLAALALYAAGQHILGLALLALSLIYHALVYAFGERLLKPPTTSAGKPHA